MTSTQDLLRARVWPARCDSHRLVVLGARPAHRGVGALRRLLTLGRLSRPVVAGLAIEGTGSRTELRYHPARGPRERAIRCWQRCLTAASCVAFASVLAFALPATAQGALPRPIYFWSNIPEPIGSSLFNNPLVIRPSKFVLFEDGQWVLQDMHWTGWGSSVARATGISSSSNDIPNAEQGKRIKTWAHVTLSNPGRFQGHEVYRCFKLTVPPPAHYGTACLARSGSVWLLLTSRG